MSKLNNKLVFNKYRVKKLLSSTGFGWVYEGLNEKENVPVAMKFEKINAKNNCLESEAFLLFNLRGFGIPKIITYGKFGLFNVLIEELLGLTIEKMWKTKKIKNEYKLKNVCMIALQMLDRLEYIHSKDIIHRDIKPHNIAIGKKDPQTIYLIDFGLSRKYRSSRTGKHIKYQNIRKAFGSLNFLSINGNKGYQQSRRDDLESFGYTIIYLLKNSLPWMKRGINENKVLKYLLVYKSKLSIPLEKLCEGLPQEIIKYIKYCRNLEFEQKPNYDYLRNLFLSILTSNAERNDLNFYWIPNKKIKNEKESKSIEYRVNNFKKRQSSQKRLYRQIKDSLDKAKSHDQLHSFKFLRLNINKEINSECKSSYKKKDNKIKNNNNIINYIKIKNEYDSPTKTENLTKNIYKKKVFDSFFVRDETYCNKLINIPTNIPEYKNNSKIEKNNNNNNNNESSVFTFQPKDDELNILSKRKSFNYINNNNILEMKNNYIKKNKSIGDTIFLQDKRGINKITLTKNSHTYRTLEERNKNKNIIKKNNNNKTNLMPDKNNIKISMNSNLMGKKNIINKSVDQNWQNQNINQISRYKSMLVKNKFEKNNNENIIILNPENSFGNKYIDNSPVKTVSYRIFNNSPKNDANSMLLKNSPINKNSIISNHKHNNIFIMPNNLSVNLNLNKLNNMSTRYSKKNNNINNIKNINNINYAKNNLFSFNYI